jgi:hypothetical protein
MTDLRALDDAFGELERRADAVTADRPLDLPARGRATSRTRLVLAGAAVVAVAGLATTTTLLVPGDDTTTQVAGPPPALSTTLSTSPATTTSEPPAAVPTDPDELAERFRAVLGGTATFTVTGTGPGAVRMTLPPGPPTAPPAGGSETAGDPGTPIGASIVGTLTAGGVTGGFDLLMYPGANPGDQAGCDSPGSPTCTVRQLPDGSSLATGETTLEGSANGKTYMVHLIRPDGVVFTMHVSNQRSPKGASDELGPRPPLTVEQLVEIATSDRW